MGYYFQKEGMSFWINFGYVLVAGYSLLILAYFIGWLWIKELTNADYTSAAQNTFTILLAARNEEDVIEQALLSIANQNYPAELYEVIVLNDHSTDATAHIVNELIKQKNKTRFKLINGDQAGFRGKKEAIAYGVSIAKFQGIILTDADCTRGNDWLNAIDQFIQKNQSQMIYAPVCFTASNLFEDAQVLEFAGLVGIGAAAIALKNPNMCSAANLYFTKTAFIEVDGYKDKSHLASGDDEFLLHKVFKKYPQQVYFLKDKRAIVYTKPNRSLNQLAQQRRRWVSKSTHYDNRYITGILVAAYLMNFGVFFNLLAGIWFPALLYAGLVQVAVKMLVESVFLANVLNFFNLGRLVFLMPLVQPFHILYVIIIGVWANINTYTWKERNVS